MRDLFEALKKRGLMLVTAESCTGGMIAKTVTDEAGSSAIFDCGFVTYSNESKTEILGVPLDMLAAHGAVSAPVAEAMAQGALTRSRADIAISCTGIAGPGGGSDDKPVGLVYIGLANRIGPPRSFAHRFEGDRDSVRRQAVEAVLSHLRNAVCK